MSSKKKSFYKSLLFFSFLFYFYPFAFSWDSPVPRNSFENSKFYHRHTVASFSALPSYIEAKDGRITFFADQNEISSNSIALYLVNRTHGDLMITNQDGFFPHLMEGLFFDGKWVRAQTYKTSWCGNSIFSIFLKHDEYIKSYSYYPTSGIPTKVRYNCITCGSSDFPGYVATNGMKSNEITGFIRLNDIIQTMHDSRSEEYFKKHGFNCSFEELKEKRFLQLCNISLGKSEYENFNTIRNRKFCLESASVYGDSRFVELISYLLRNSDVEFRIICLRTVLEAIDPKRQNQIPALTNYNSILIKKDFLDCFLSSNDTEQLLAYLILKRLCD